MSLRPPLLQTFLNQAENAFGRYATSDASRRSISSAFKALDAEKQSSNRDAARLPVCDIWLSQALDLQALPDRLRILAEAFLAIEPQVHWRTRSGDQVNASATFEAGHANAMIVGPGGIEPRTDVWIGASLLAPNLRYPDHMHPPEETYLVLSTGEFSQNDGDWFAPGIGGSFYNPPGILHAMKSGPAPLFAFWLLRAQEA